MMGLFPSEPSSGNQGRGGGGVTSETWWSTDVVPQKYLGSLILVFRGLPEVADQEVHGLDDGLKNGSHVRPNLDLPGSGDVWLC